MRALSVLAALTLATAAWAADPEPEPAPAGAVGSWRVAAATDRGRPVPEDRLKAGSFSFTKDRLCMSLTGRRQDEFAYKLDPSAKPQNSRVFLDAIPNIRHVPTVSTWPEIEDAIEGELEQGLYEGVPPQEVAEKAIEATTPMFARAET